MDSTISSFESAHQLFVERHEQSRNGERKGRLLRGHQYAEKLFLEKVWWPLFNSFDHLHPEFEIVDWNRKSQFLDFAFLTPFGRVGIEIDGFQAHVKEMDREKFSYSLNRDTFLSAMGWRMVHFSFDDVQQRPEVCQMLLQLIMSPYLLSHGSDIAITLEEKEVLRLMWQHGNTIRPIDVANMLQISSKSARRILLSAAKKGYVRSLSNGRVVRYYELHEAGFERLCKVWDYKLSNR